MDVDRLEEIEDQGPDWSVSRLQTIFSCGRRYQFKYVDRVKELPGPPLAFGSAIHKTIETLTLNNTWEDPDLQRMWSDNWYEASTAIDWEHTNYRKHTYDLKGPKILETYRDKHKDDQWLGLEVHFRAGLGSGLPGLRGTYDKIQRLTEHPDVPPQYIGKLAVVDYKTSKNPPDPLLLSVDPQLTIYHKSFKELTGEDVVVGLHHLPTDTIYWKLPGPQDFDNIVVPMLKRGLKRVENQEFERNISWTCKFCPFKEQCLGGISGPVETSRDIP